MKSIVIYGGSPLGGSISVSGSKNAALPILFATIITGGVSRIDNLPDIGDVRITLDILGEFGAEISRQGRTVFIDTTNLTYKLPNARLVCGIRASTYLIGACLSRFGKCELPKSGGCNFSERPIDLHIAAAEALGGRIEGDVIVTNGLSGGRIDFRKPSVGATVNAILLAASAKGETVIRGGACEPHIDTLIRFLVSAGAGIERRGGEIIIKGRELHGGNIRIPGDMIEAGTYLALGALSERGITVTDFDIAEFSAVSGTLRAIGAVVTVTDDRICVHRGEEMRYAELTATPFPGFPTDLQPLFAIPMHIAGGKITDEVWRTRFGYLEELSHFGVVSKVKGNSAYISPSRLCCSRGKAPDLRGGMALVMAGLLASGKSTVESYEIVERGYENLENKLSGIGASVEITEN